MRLLSPFTELDSYVSQIDKVAVNVLIANGSNGVLSFLSVMELAHRPMEQNGVENATHNFIHLMTLCRLEGKTE